MADGSKALARREDDGGHLLSFTAQQEQMISDTFLNGAPPAEARVLLEVARLRGLNPITRQIHFVKRWDGQKKREVWSPQVSIDGLRAIAERTGRYDGQDEPEYEVGANGLPTKATVRVYRKDIGRPFVGVAHWSEFVQTNKDGKTTGMWGRMPFLMLAKCAEALAIRKAFPEDSGGLYTDDEMMQADNPRDVTPPPQQQRAAPAKPKPAPVRPAPVVEVKDEAPPHDPQTGEVVDAEYTPVEEPALSFAAREAMERIKAADSRAALKEVGTIIKAAVEAGEVTAQERETLMAAYTVRQAEVR